VQKKNIYVYKIGFRVLYFSAGHPWYMF